MNMQKFFLRHINGFFPFLYSLQHILKGGNYFKGIFNYYRDYWQYTQKNNELKTPFPVTFKDMYPIYFDRYEEAGEVPKHYFYLDLWAAKKIYASKTKIHYDIGSRLDSFISHCLVFTKVVMLDVRPLKSKIQNLSFIQADCRAMPQIKTGSITSISALHSFEHFGLGRYGDPIDPQGYLLAINEIQRVTKKGGSIYFGTPIGKQRLEFNAHRVFDPEYIVALFDGCKLESFAAVNDQDIYVEKAKIRDYKKADYSCGLYHFVKI